MARKPIKPKSDQAIVPPELIVTRLDADHKIKDRIEKGKELCARQINSRDQLEINRKDYYKWSDYNKELLKRLFSNSSLADEYSGSGFGIITLGGHSSLQEDITDFRKNINNKIHRLESIRERLELIPEEPSDGPLKISSITTPNLSTEKAFVVHGHDEGARESVARFLEKLGLEAIILHEQASGGRTIIEKLEYNSDVGFAVILLTPDDIGAATSAQQSLNPRARQNVILELGYFVAKLGRSRVCALYKGNVELPSDFLGVVYIPLDSNGAWRVLLAKELREAGFTVDLNKAI